MVLSVALAVVLYKYPKSYLLSDTVKPRIQEHPFSGFRLIGFLYIGYFR